MAFTMISLQSETKSNLESALLAISLDMWPQLCSYIERVSTRVLPHCFNEVVTTATPTRRRCNSTLKKFSPCELDLSRKFLLKNGSKLRSDARKTTYMLSIAFAAV